MKDNSFIKLTEIADVISGYAFDSKWFDQGKKKIVRITDLVDGNLDSDSAVTFDHLTNFVSDQYVARNQDVLIALSGATTGKIGVVTSKDEEVYVNQRIAIVRGKTEQAKNWLPYLLMSDIAKKLILTAGGTAQPNLSINDLKALPVPDLSSDQQCQIAAKLKSQFNEVETARKALKCQKQEVVNLANAFIRESIQQSPVIETRLGEVLDEVKKGIGESWADYPVLGATRDGLAPAKTEGAGHARDMNHPGAHSRVWPAPTKDIKGIDESWADYPVLGATRDGLAPAKTVGAGHARDMSHPGAQSRAWPAPTREAPGKHPQRYKPVFCGTVFYNPMSILIGSIAFVEDDDEPGITSPDYVALQGKSGLVDSRWFYYWLRSPNGEHCINSLARGAVRERMLFNRLAEGSILLPPYPEQLRVSKALATLKSVKHAIQKQLDDLNKIPERLLAQAFNDVISK